MSDKPRNPYAWETVEGEETAPQEPISSPESIPVQETKEELAEWQKRKKAEDRKLDEKFRLVKGTWLERKWLPSRSLTVTVRQLKRWGFDYKRLIATGVIVREKSEK